MNTVPKQKYGILFFTLFVLTVLYSFIYLGVLSDWWIDDDPGHYALVQDVNAFSDFFTSKDKLRYGAGNALTPFHLFSFWVDMQIAPHNVQFAYLHHTFSFFVTVLLFGMLLLNWSGSLVITLAASVLWILIPSTQTIAEFVSTRHYLEGLQYALLAIFLAQRSIQNTKNKSSILILLALLSLAIAMLHKELYVLLPGALVLLLWIRHKKYFGIFGILVTLIAYTAYRLWALGSSVNYTMPFLGPKLYLKYLMKIPYLFAGSYCGYLVLVMAVLLLALAYKSNKLKIWVLGIYGFAIALSLATIYPVAYAVSENWKDLGTWYRAHFILNTILLFALVHLVSLFQEKIRGIAFLILFACLISGSMKSRVVWDNLKDRYRLEGEFILNPPSPDAMLYSEVPAYWFTKTLEMFYKLPERNWVTWYALHTNSLDNNVLNRSKVLYKVQDGKLIEDPVLLENLKRHASKVTG